MDTPTPEPRRPIRRKLFAALATACGAVLLAFEFLRPHGSTGERWFWIFVGGLLVSLGVAELRSTSSRLPPHN